VRFFSPLCVPHRKALKEDCFYSTTLYFYEVARKFFSRTSLFSDQKIRNRTIRAKIQKILSAFFCHLNIYVAVFYCNMFCLLSVFTFSHTVQPESEKYNIHFVFKTILLSNSILLILSKLYYCCWCKNILLIQFCFSFLFIISL